MDGSFHGSDEMPDWYREMVENAEINVVHNALIATLGFQAEELDDDGNIVNIKRGEDFSVVFQTDHPEIEGEQVYCLFTLSPPAALAVAHMILRRFPKEIIADIMYQAVNNPGPPVQYEMTPAVPPSQEGINYIKDRLNRQAKGYET